MTDRTGRRSASIPTGPAAPRGQRADAARNRSRVLTAARRLVEQHGIEAVTMDDVAAEARVGKGTVYRAFGNRGGLAEALVDDAERELQRRVIEGPAPLGPGADPRRRLAAFADAFLRFLDRNVELLVETDHHVVGGRFATGAYSFWRTHVARLAEAAGASEPDITAELVLALLSADLYQHLRQGRRVSAVRLRRQAIAAVVSVALPSAT